MTVVLVFNGNNDRLPFTFFCHIDRIWTKSGNINLFPVDSTVIPVSTTVMNVVSNSTPVNILPITSVVLTGRLIISRLLQLNQQ